MINFDLRWNVKVIIASDKDDWKEEQLEYLFYFRKKIYLISKYLFKTSNKMKK